MNLLINEEDLKYYKEQITEVEKLLNGYIAFLERKIAER